MSSFGIVDDLETVFSGIDVCIADYSVTFEVDDTLGSLLLRTRKKGEEKISSEAQLITKSWLTCSDLR